jgi:L-threonylcarbamoyladenylate synthase
MSIPTLSVPQACEALNAGELVVFPTETFFAVGCDAMNPDAVGAVFSLKKRSLNMPLPVIVGNRERLVDVAAYVSDTARSLMDAFWPGPLSIVFPARPEVPELLTANAGRIAVRCSPHEVARRLCAVTGKVLVASSANVSGHSSAARVEELDPDLVAGTAGVCLSEVSPEGGLPSTVVDVLERREGAVVRVLRQGAIGVPALRDAGFSVRCDECESEMAAM